MKSLFLALSLLSAQAFGAFTVPALPNPVNDYSNVLTVDGKEKIASAIVQLKKDTGAQAGVLIVDTLNGDSVEEASMKVATAWKLGSAKNDDGILLLVVVKDRKLRIEVGQGLESVVTDAHSKRILGTMKSALKAGNWDAGVLTGVQGIATKIKAGKDEIQKGTTTSTGDSTGFVIFLAIMAGIGAIAVVFHLKRVNDEKEEEETLRRRRNNERSTVTPQDFRSTRDEVEDSGVANAAIIAAAIAASQNNEPVRRPHNDDDGEARRRRDEEDRQRRRRNDDDDSSRRSSSYDSSSSSSSSSGSDWGGGGGGFSGGGSSDSF